MAERRTVGLDIGTTGVRAAQLSWHRDGARLERIGQVALPEGAVTDGEVTDPAAVGAALKQLWKLGRFSTKKVILGVANQKVIVRQVDLPWMPLAEMRKSLAFQVADVIPLPIEHALLDFHPLEEIQGEDGERRHRVLIVAAAREMVQASLDAVAIAGLDPQAVDLTSFALLRAIGTVDGLGITRSAEALVDIGANVTNIAVHQGGVPRFVRILVLGGSDVSQKLAEHMGIPLEQAEYVKQTTPAPRDPTLPSASPVVRALESAANDWVEEVRGSLGYYAAQPGSSPIGRVLLSGGGSQLPGLAQRLSAATHLPVEVAAPMHRLEIGRTGLSDDQLHYMEALSAVPVGLALGAAA